MEPIAYTLRWTPELLREGLRAKASRWGRAGQLLSFRARLIWALAILSLPLIGWTIAIQGFGAALADAQLFGVGLLTGMVLLRVTWSYYRRREAAPREREMLDQSEGAKVSLDADGLTVALEWRRAWIAWSALQAVEPFDRAVWLSFEGAFGLPVPDDALPEGVDRAELLRRLDAWRGSEPFR